MASVFLSYDHEDAARAAPIAAALEANRHSVWWDRQIHGGAEYNSAIEAAVETSDAVVVLWSEKSVRSPWVRDEAGEGRDRGKLVPVLIDAVKPPMGFRQFQTLDLSSWTGGKRIPNLKQLLEAVDKVGAQRSAGQPSASLPAPTHAPRKEHPYRAESTPLLSRRTAISSGALALFAAASGAVWYESSRRSDPRVQAIIDESEEALRHQTADEKTIRALRQAAAIEPNNPRALGLLALTLALVGTSGEMPQYAPEAERIARRAVALDAKESNALVAIFELQGSTLDWFTRDQRLRQILAIDGQNVTAISELVLLLQATGYCRDSWNWNERAVALEPLSPDFLAKRALKLWILGRVSEADKVADQVRALYPKDPFVLFVRLHIYAFTGRAQAGLAMLNSGALFAPPLAVAAWRTSLTALDHPTPANTAKARAACIAGAPTSGIFATDAALIMSALGDLDTAFSIANGFLLARGPLAQREETGTTNAAESAAWRLSTQWMFTPPAKPMQQDARFLPLCEGVGLTDYWRKRGVKPDYQRG